MNNFNPNLEFTSEKMVNDKINFLDTTIFLKNGTPELRHHIKEGADISLNFREAVMPKSQLIGILCGEIYRARNATTDDSDFELIIHEIEKKYINLDYPSNLVRTKISEITERNFLPKTDKKTKEKERIENPDKHFNIVIKYTSPRCEKISKKNYPHDKKYSPKYKINFCWKNIRRNNFLSPKLKHQTNTEDKNCSVYNFLCDCLERYIGESKRQLKVRIQEHQQTSRDTAIVQHTLTCPTYQDLYKTALGESPTFHDRINVLQNRFTILFSNLTNTNHRKRMEAVAIKLFCPKLNEQVNH